VVIHGGESLSEVLIVFEGFAGNDGVYAGEGDFAPPSVMTFYAAPDFFMHFRKDFMGASDHINILPIEYINTNVITPREHSPHVPINIQTTNIDY
jgi:hypothetical protein